jgi:hypothetical protein
MSEINGVAVYCDSTRTTLNIKYLCIRADTYIICSYMYKYMQILTVHLYVCIQKYSYVYASICRYLFVFYQCSHSLTAMIASGKGSTTRLA